MGEENAIFGGGMITIVAKRETNKLGLNPGSWLLWVSSVGVMLDFVVQYAFSLHMSLH